MNNIKICRICDESDLELVLNLGNQALTGIFPKAKNSFITYGNLEVVWCKNCGLLQLSNSFDLNEMYGKNYGYRSGLNPTMVGHLKNKVKQLKDLRPVNDGELVLDIGSNDGTLLSAYDNNKLLRVGIDPTGVKFKKYYEDGIDLISDFFTAKKFKDKFGEQKAQIITSISMFYDLEKPGEFVEDISRILDKNGIWHLEQSYMPSMLRMNSYDTICHEHLEYYSLRVLKNLLENHNLKIIDVSTNSINGGSFAVTAAHNLSSMKENSSIIDWMLGQEDRMELTTPKPYLDFKNRIFKHREDLVRLIETLTKNGKKIIGYGASTKGNVLLQFCGFTENEIKCIAEINPDKFNCFTPGSKIPILSEKDAKSLKPDYMLVLPWHFRDSIIKREEKFLRDGGKLIFPMPEIEII